MHAMRIALRCSWNPWEQRFRQQGCSVVQDRLKHLYGIIFRCEITTSRPGSEPCQSTLQKKHRLLSYPAWAQMFWAINQPSQVKINPMYGEVLSSCSPPGFSPEELGGGMFATDLESIGWIQGFSAFAISASMVLFLWNHKKQQQIGYFPNSKMGIICLRCENKNVTDASWVEEIGSSEDWSSSGGIRIAASMVILASFNFTSSQIVYGSNIS